MQLLIAAAISLSVALPPPGGPYRVGTTRTIDLVDESRRETAVTDPRIRRQVLIQLWYPTDARRGVHAPYIERLRAYTESTPMLDPMGGTMDASRAAVYANVVTNSLLDAQPVRGKRFPLVMISHGWQASKSDYTILAESLASRGYVVCGVDHPYMGHIALANGTVTQSIDSQFESPHASTQYYAADVLFAVGALRASQYRDAIDFARVALIGHSSGYGAVRDAAVADPAIRAVVDIDGNEKHPEFLAGLTQPILWIRLARAGPPPEAFVKTAVAPVKVVSIDGAKHGAIMDDDVIFAHSVAERNEALRQLRAVEQAILGFLAAL